MNKRLGFHYFQDVNHFQVRDLNLWLPELQALNAGWLVHKKYIYASYSGRIYNRPRPRRNSTYYRF